MGISHGQSRIFLLGLHDRRGGPCWGMRGRRAHIFCYKAAMRECEGGGRRSAVLTRWLGHFQRRCCCARARPLPSLQIWGIASLGFLRNLPRSTHRKTKRCLALSNWRCWSIASGKGRTTRDSSFSPSDATACTISWKAIGPSHAESLSHTCSSNSSPTGPNNARQLKVWMMSWDLG